MLRSLTAVMNTRPFAAASRTPGSYLPNIRVASARMSAMTASATARRSRIRASIAPTVAEGPGGSSPGNP